MNAFTIVAVNQAADSARVPAAVVRAMVQVESGGNPYAYNPEARYPYLWNVRTKAPFRKITDAEAVSKFPPADFPTLAGDPDQEFWAQQASWGLMQVMGAVARERGFIGHYLTQLSEVRINLEIGCRHLAGLIAWAGRSVDGQGEIDKAVAAYNAGPGGFDSPAGQGYVRKVRSAMAKENTR